MMIESNTSPSSSPQQLLLPNQTSAPAPVGTNYF